MTKCKFLNIANPSIKYRSISVISTTNGFDISKYIIYECRLHHQKPVKNHSLIYLNNSNASSWDLHLEHLISVSVY